MRRQQRARLLRDDRLDVLFHVSGVQGVQLAAREAGQRRQLEIEEFVDIQRAGLVLLVEVVVLPRVVLGVEDAAFDQEFRPFAVGVANDQGVVQVKQGKIHGVSAFGRGGL
ncbi:hypothetical protein D3C72_2079060 [compost metagenome]